MVTRTLSKYLGTIFNSCRMLSSKIQFSTLNILCSSESSRKPSFNKKKPFGQSSPSASSSSSERRDKPIENKKRELKPIKEKKPLETKKSNPAVEKKENSDNKKEKKLTYSSEEKSHYFQQIIFPLRKALKERNIESYPTSATSPIGTVVTDTIFQYCN